MLAKLLIIVCSLHEITCKLNPPHVILIVADDLGWNDVGWHNPQMLTPNLDKYARKGVALNSSYVQPVCSPTRNCLMTGYFPYHTGLQHSVIHPNRPKFVPSNFSLLPQRLKTVGYQTHIVGKWHLGFCNWKYTPTYRGFDTFYGYYNGAEDYYTHIREKGFDFRLNASVFHAGDGVYSAMLLAERAGQIIRSHDQRQPLFLYLPFQSVHEPLEVPKRFEDLYSNIKHHDRRIYCGMVSALDEAFGNVTKALEESGIANNMLLIFTTDNGGPTYSGANNLPLRGAKTTTWEGGTKGAAFVYSQNLLRKQGYTNTGLIHAVDWYPTILELAGIKPDTNMDGISQLNTILSDSPSLRTEFVYNIDDVENTSAIRYGDYKLIQGGAGKYNGWHPLPTVNEDPTIRMGSANTEVADYMLFNIKEDPTEHHDMAKTQPDILEMMKTRLQKWKSTLVPAQNPPPDPNSNPKHFGGVWSPGWC